jgi:23S rRNA pseudouridine1911/1915/1917 synthase
MRLAPVKSGPGVPPIGAPQYIGGAVRATESGEPPGNGIAPATVLRFPAAEGAGQRADRYLASRIGTRVPEVSRSRLQQWFALGAVWCEERVLLPATRLAGYETLLVQPLPREADDAFVPEPLPIDVIHEDADLLVIAKPAGLVVHPAAGHWRGTLLNGLLHRRPALARLPRAGIVHRLDKDTSGLLAVAASERGLASLVAQLSDRSMSRRYLALAAGEIASATDIDAPIGRDPRHRTRMAVLDPQQGRAARTSIRPLAAGMWQRRPVTLIECRLHTGRTHQIRVHLQHVGHPLIGDPVYGAGGVAPIARQALHAWRLGCLHPSGSGPQHWHDPPPTDFIDALTACGIARGVLPDA